MTSPAKISPARGPLGDLVADHAICTTFRKAGAQTVVALPATEIFYNDYDMPLNIMGVRASLGTANTGSTFIVDVQVNGTSIFATTTANRPTIAISGTTAKSGTPDTKTVPANGSVTASVLQIGSTVAGSDLAVQVCMYA